MATTDAVTSDVTPSVTISAGTTATGSSYTGSSSIIFVYGIANNFTVTTNAQIYVQSGGVTNNNIVSSGGFEVISAGGVANTTQVTIGGYESIYAGGSSISATIAGTQALSSGASADASTIVTNGAQTIAITAIASNTIINGGRQTVSGTATDTTLLAGTQTIAGNGVATNTIINSGATQQITNLTTATSPIANNTTVSNGGKILNLGGTVNSAIISSGGTIAVYGMSRAASTIIYGKSYNTTVQNGGTETVGINPTNSSTTGPGISYSAQLYGAQTVYSGSFASNATILNGGTQNVMSGATIYESVVSSGGKLNVTSGGLLTGNTTLEDGGTATIYNNAGGSIDLVGNSNAGLTISGLTNGGTVNTVITVISGFSGTAVGSSDIITLAGITKDDVTDVKNLDAEGNTNNDYVTLYLSNGGTIVLNIVGAGSLGYSLANSADGSSLTYEVCFLAGAMIKTPTGEVAVEDIRIGDEVITFDWKNNKETIRPVCWVGNKQAKVNHDLSKDEAGYPVRILKDAITDGVPYKDLLVTAEHCLFFDNRFIPARMLVNGVSIYYDYSITEYTYYHIETDEHSVIWADGALTESYLDTGNRDTFRQHGNLVLFRKPSPSKKWDTHAGAPLNVNRSFVEPIYNQLAQRSKMINITNHHVDLPTTYDPNFYLVTDKDTVIEPYFNGKDRYNFLLPEGVERVFLKSRTSRPCDVVGSFVDDRRQLGVLIGDISLLTYNHTYKITDHLSKENISGWDILENRPYRWTNGNAQLDLNQSDSMRRVLIIQVLSSSLYLLNDQNDMAKTKDVA